MSKVLIFPPTKQNEALAYAAAADDLYAATFEPGGIFSYCRNDKFGNWVVPYYGPNWTFDGSLFEEPESMIPYRVDGVIQNFVEWPDDL